MKWETKFFGGVICVFLLILLILYIIPVENSMTEFTKNICYVFITISMLALGIIHGSPYVLG